MAFRFFRELLEEKYGKEEAGKRIYATTDKARGALKSLADAEGWETFVVPDDIGGRYSVLTAVGLLPIAVTGVDVEALMEGAAEMMNVCADGSYDSPAWQYATLRYELYRAGYAIEILGCYDPAFRFMTEWWKQLYGRERGKGRQGPVPRQCGVYRRPALHGAVYSGGPPDPLRDDRAAGCLRPAAGRSSGRDGRRRAELPCGCVYGPHPGPGPRRERSWPTVRAAYPTSL